MLRRSIKADAVVVGGGYAGLTIALWLSRAGLQTVLLEALQPGNGTSGKCTGIVSVGLGPRFSQIEKEKGTAAADDYSHTILRAIRMISELNETFHFGLQQIKGCITAEHANDIPSLAMEYEAMKRAGYPARFRTVDEMYPQAQGVLVIEKTYLLESDDYLAFLLSQAERMGTAIYGDSRVIGFETSEAYTELGSVEATYMIIATGYPVLNIPGWFFTRLEQRPVDAAFYCGPSSGIGTGMTVNGETAWRPCREGVVLRSTNACAEDENRETMFVKQGSFVKTDERKSGIDCFTPDGIPYIGRYSQGTPNLYVATGFCGNGLIGSMLAAQAISAYIVGHSTAEYDLYSPRRANGSLSSTLRLGKKYLKGIWGKSGSPRCTHMGCRLVYNPQTRMWECPCHGSRFDQIGRVVSAPAVKAAQLGKRK